MKQLGLIVLFASILAALIQLAWHLSVLPAQVASHFNAAGEADGFMSKNNYGLFMLGLLIGMPAFLFGAAKLARKLPTSMINIPNREYWLHADRKEQTLEETETVMIWIAVATELFFVGLAQLTYVANVQKQNLSGLGFWLLMAAYLVVVLGLVIRMTWKYRLPDVAS